MGSAAPRFIGDDADSEFALTDLQLASARDPHVSFRRLAEEAPASVADRNVGRPWFVWRHDLELARSLNDRLASDTID